MSLLDGPPTAGPVARSRVLARHVPLDTAFNLRDLGGYPTADGRAVVWGRAYRADGLHAVEGRDLDRVRSLGLRTVIDLRTEPEVDGGTFPVRALPVDLHHLPVLARVWDDDDEVEAVAHRATPYLVARYLDMLDEGGPAFVAALELLAAVGHRPFVFHCAAGKDRTGVLAALLLAVLGVADAEIAADYALSEDAMARRLEWARRHRPDEAEAMTERPVGWSAAPPDVVLAVLAHLRAAHGGAAGYLEEHGLAPAAVDDLRAHLLT